MTVINMLDAKTNLSRLVEAVESGRESEIIIARNGKPVARLVPVAAPADVSKRIGVAIKQASGWTYDARLHKKLDREIARSFGDDTSK